MATVEISWRVRSCLDGPQYLSRDWDHRCYSWVWRRGEDRVEHRADSAYGGKSENRREVATSGRTLQTCFRDSNRRHGRTICWQCRYSRARAGPGLIFPELDAVPSYGEFVYFAFFIGMTYQVADTWRAGTRTFAH